MSETPKETKPIVATDAELYQKVATLEAKLKTREDQLREAVDFKLKVDAEKIGKDAAEKQSLIDMIIIDGKFSRDELQKESLETLRVRCETLDRGLDKHFASVAAMDKAERERKNQPYLTVGAYDSETKTWKGGI